MKSEEIISVIKENRILGCASEETIKRHLNEQSVYVADFKAGDVIYSRCSPKKYVGIMLCGRSFAESEGSKDNSVLRMMGSEDMFGVANLYCDNTPFPSVIIAKTASRVMFIDGDAFRSVIESDNGALRAYLAFMSNRIVYLNKKISTLTAGTTEKKLSLFLAENEEDGMLPSSISMSALAELLGVGRASLYRAIDALAAQGIISKRGTSIRIIDKNALLNIE